MLIHRALGRPFDKPRVDVDQRRHAGNQHRHRHQRRHDGKDPARGTDVADGHRRTKGQRNHKRQQRPYRAIQRHAQQRHEQKKQREVAHPGRAGVGIQVGVDVRLTDLAQAGQRRGTFLAAGNRGIDPGQGLGALGGAFDVQDQGNRQEVIPVKSLALKQIGAGDKLFEVGSLLGRSGKAGLGATKHRQR